MLVTINISFLWGGLTGGEKCCGVLRDGVGGEGWTVALRSWEAVELALNISFRILGGGESAGCLDSDGRGLGDDTGEARLYRAGGDWLAAGVETTESGLDGVVDGRVQLGEDGVHHTLRVQAVSPSQQDRPLGRGGSQSCPGQQANNLNMIINIIVL